jgi:hypothetical protein
MTNEDEYLPGDERWDINDLSGTRNEDGTWDVMIRARVRLEDEVGARAFFLQSGSPDVPLTQEASVVTNTVASALVRGEDHILTPSPVTFVAVTVGVGRDSFSGANEGM